MDKVTQRSAEPSRICACQLAAFDPALCQLDRPLDNLMFVCPIAMSTKSFQTIDRAKKPRALAIKPAGQWVPQTKHTLINFNPSHPRITNQFSYWG